MKTSYKSGPRFGPNAWSWKDKKKQQVEDTPQIPEVIVASVVPTAPVKIPEPVVIPVMQQIVEPIPVKEIEVQQTSSELTTDEEKSAEIQKSIDKKKK